jgi:hypothetical protein
LQNVKKFVEFLNENGEEGYKLIRDQITPLLSDILNKRDNIKVIDLCSEALVDITKYIREEDRGMSILTIVIGIIYFKNSLGA